MTDIPTIASGAAPTAPSADPGELGPSIARESPKAPATSPPKPESGKVPPRSYEQRRLAQDQAAAPTDKAPASPAGDQQQPPADASGKVQVGKYEIDETRLGEMMQRQATDDLRKATLPAAPEGYEAKLPEGLQLPGGIEYKFDPSDPSMVAARNLAHAKGWSQQDFSDALAIFASHQAQQEATLRARSQAELAKAGINVGQRVDSVGRWLDGFMGTADAAPIKATLVTDAHLRFVEQVMTKLQSQGSASFSQSHRVPADDRTSIPGYANMSFEERRFAQDQQRNRRR